MERSWKKAGAKRVFESGQWNWSWPKPIDEVIHVPVKQIRTLTINNFWYHEDTPKRNEKDPKSMIAGKTLVPGIDGYLLTGDNNIVHTKWSLAYRISDPVLFFSKYIEPEVAITKTMENAVIKCISKTTIDHALFRNSEQLRLLILEEVRRNLAHLKLGVNVENVTYDSKEPPLPTRSSFQAAIQAEQQKDERINSALSFAEETKQKAFGTSSQIIANAEKYRKRIVSAVEADKNYFSKILGEYKKSPGTVLLPLYSNAMNEILSKVDRKFIMHAPSKENEREIRLLFSANPNRNSRPTTEIDSP